MGSSLLTGLAKKVVLVTGSTSGIGRYAAVEFAKNGSRLVLTGRRQDALIETAAQCQQAGVSEESILQLQADLENVDECKKVVSKTVDKFGQLDVLVNAAGILTSGGIENLSLEDYDKQMNVNARALFVTTQAAVPHLKITKGSIVNVSSVTGLRAFPGVLSYCMSKGAVDQLTRCVALDLAEYGIRCNSVNPGVIVTSLHKSAGMNDEAYQK
ncbi:2-(R)-hydroxypropyl-CoM dehydrogenase [Orchesella cincta]|uniref:2-(R)-hydroxypropyl-CoM dehydrogenase n=1 Tax=Orchesella cincta TaxID=48709 RepID=A0A1D2MCW0_ORCCI|nr:2-(R)-hydroxypropyl-CoM dehydrogenase [Orchesella cincta]